MSGFRVGDSDFIFLHGFSLHGLAFSALEPRLKLEQVGYLEVLKAFRGKVPVTSFKITQAGRDALAGYWTALRGAIPSG